MGHPFGGGLLMYARGLVLPAVLLGVWYVLGSTGHLDASIFPTIGQVAQAAVHLGRTGQLVSHVYVSLTRVAQGFAWAAAVGVPVGIVLGWSRRAKPWLDPTIHFLRQIPPIAWIPVFILWFGIGEASKVVVIFYAALFPILVNTTLGVQQIPRSLWEVAALLRFSLAQYLTRLVVPGSAPSIMTGLRLGMGMSWRVLVAAEMLAASSGLGFLIMSSRSLVRLDDMLVGILTIGLVGVAIDGLFIQLQRLLLPWSGEVYGAYRRSTSN